MQKSNENKKVNKKQQNFRHNICTTTYILSNLTTQKLRTGMGDIPENYQTSHVLGFSFLFYRLFGKSCYIWPWSFESSASVLGFSHGCLRWVIIVNFQKHKPVGYQVACQQARSCRFRLLSTPAGFWWVSNCPSAGACMAATNPAPTLPDRCASGLIPLWHICTTIKSNYN